MSSSLHCTLSHNGWLQPSTACRESKISQFTMMLWVITIGWGWRRHITSTCPLILFLIVGSMPLRCCVSSPVYSLTDFSALLSSSWLHWNEERLTNHTLHLFIKGNPGLACVACVTKNSLFTLDKRSLCERILLLWESLILCLKDVRNVPASLSLSLSGSHHCC